ncbi:hypothetical protein [Pontibacter sp. G13]|uniref:hypothetical protein n=1 Tax=Pontibacter sp. G13 TaxID=3074898 RepID=UPI0028898A01|nr:hypothetical protein [Pontibacter sp. G13]WNJ17273.1 hypothetical protein RJD25_20675 [Pontibacter sp. G13]
MIRALLLTVMLSAGWFAQLVAQDFFEGTISFEVKMEGAKSDLLKQNEPNTKLTMHFKGGDYIVLLAGGRYPKTFLYRSEENIQYSVDLANRMAFKFSSHNDMNAQKERVAVKPTGKQQEVAGVLCDEYYMKKGESEFYFYASPDYTVDTSLYPEKPQTKATFLIKGLEGRIPLKTVKKEAGLTVTTLAKKVGRAEFDPAQFMIPPDFEIKKRDYRF